MKRRIVFTAEAQCNADKIYDWLAERSPQGAVTWFAAFLAAVDSLAVDAERLPTAPESNKFSHPVRQLLFKTQHGRCYRILFVLDDLTVTILHVRGPGQAPVQP